MPPVYRARSDVCVTPQPARKVRIRSSQGAISGLLQTQKRDSRSLRKHNASSRYGRREAREKARGGGGRAAAVDPYLLRAHEAPNQALVARESAQADRDSAWSTAAARPPPPLAADQEHHPLLTLILLRVTGANVARPLVDLECLRILVVAPQHHRVVLQQARQRRMIRPQAPLDDGDGARVDGRRLVPAPFRAVHLG